MKKEECNKEAINTLGCPFCEVPICLDAQEAGCTCGCAEQIRIHNLDCVGLYCPVPVMRAKEEIDRLESGSLIEIVADDPAAEEDVPRWAKRAGHRLIRKWRDGKELHFLVQKNSEEDSLDG